MKNKKESKKKINTKKNKKESKISIFLKKEDKYTNKDILLVTFSSIIFGFAFCMFILMFITGGKNIFVLFTDLKEFLKSYTALTEKYYGDINKEEIINGAIKGMYISVNDGYTTYMDKEESDSFTEEIDGEYEGIGCSIITNDNGQIEVYEIFEGSPADKAKLQVGDIITEVDGVDYSKSTSVELSTYVKTSNSKKITLTIIREGETKTIKISREKIEIPSVSSRIFEEKDHKIGYISIEKFSSVTTKQLKKNLSDLEKNNIDSLIIDVRNNGGGYLDCVTDIANIFLKKGKIIYQLENDKKTEIIKSTTKEHKDYDIVVLVNEGSASASEILASALKESYNSHVVGTNTFGKGTVQETIKMKDGSIVKYTAKKWLTPDGNWINEVGVEPTDKVEQNEEYYKNPTDDNDAQLQKALEILKK